MKHLKFDFLFNITVSWKISMPKQSWYSIAPIFIRSPSDCGFQNFSTSITKLLAILSLAVFVLLENGWGNPRSFSNILTGKFSDLVSSKKETKQLNVALLNMRPMLLPKRCSYCSFYCCCNSWVEVVISTWFFDIPIFWALKLYLGKNFVSSGHLCDTFCLAQPKPVYSWDKTMYASSDKYWR